MSQTPERNRRTQRNQALYESSSARQQRAALQRERQPIGVSPELRERQRMYQEQYQKYRADGRAFQRQQDVYDDMENRRYVEPAPQQLKGRKKRKKKRHTGLWALVTLVCWICIGVIALFAAPQVLGVQYAGMPNFAFVGGSIVALDQSAYENYVLLRKYMNTDTIFPGVSIDGVDVSGMTRDQAVQALSQVSASGGGEFSITINVGNGTWTIDSTMVPMTRNLTQVVNQAYALGRGNTTNIRGTSITPFQERMNEAASLRNNPVSLQTALTYDKSAVRGLVEAIVSFVNRDPQNAQVAEFDFNTRAFGFSQDVSGAYLDVDALYNQVIGYLDNGHYYATIDAIPQEILAQVTKAELMNSFRMISSYTTETTSNANRNTNIDLSANAINGVTVNPGETFSFNQATGQRTWEKGYREATAIAGGQNVPEIGGGVCQTSSTLFNAVARANLEIVDRSPHAWPSSYVEKGMDATVNWPNLDFKFRNNTDWPIFIVSYYKNRKVTVEIYGMYLGDGVTIDLESVVTKTTRPPSDVKYVQNTSLPVGTQKTTIEARTGYQVETYKIWYQNGQEISRELLCKSTYKMYQETVEWN